MKAAEILRKLADMIDSHSDGESAETTSAVELAPVEVDNTDNSTPSTMVPPLQAKLELLKKATGVDSHYDDECDAEEESDELDIIRQNAGIPTVIVSAAGEDNDITG